MRQTKVKIPAFHAKKKNHSMSRYQANILRKLLPDGDVAG